LKDDLDEAMKKATKSIIQIIRSKKINAWAAFLFTIYIIFIFKFFLVKQTFAMDVFVIYAMLVFVYIFSRLLLSYFYEPAPDNDHEPTVTFVVPTMNEEDAITVTLEMIYNVDYPKEKLEVIAINDGSTDNTLQRMKEVQRYHPDMVIVDFKKNQGKRHGMAEGARRAKNDILIFIDSDSFVERSSIRALVKYFVDPEVGAVSGHTDVLNNDTNIITQMQAIKYYCAFALIKSSESLFSSVTCCSGCFSAYRREYVMEVLDEWLNQTFMGVQCTYGDDRSLTNYLLKKYKLKYSAEAQAWTEVPDTFKKLTKQQQRWKKSWVRESLMAGRFMWKKNPIVALTFYSGILLGILAPLVFIKAMFWVPFTHHVTPLYYVAGLVIISFLYGLYYAIKTGEKKWFISSLACWIFYVLLLYQIPYAVLTIRDTRWGTR
jgi:hyaluronan synthase